MYTPAPDYAVNPYPPGSHPASVPGLSRWRRALGSRTGRLTAASVGTFAVLALVLNFFVVWPWDTTPESLVRDYLEAVRAKDIEAALDLAWPFRDDPDYTSSLNASDEDETFLTPDALSSDWSVDRIEQRQDNDFAVNVDVTISAGDLSGVGRFAVVNNPDYGWVISDPYAHANLRGAPLTYTELDGTSAEELPSATFTLFPGVYRPYTEAGDLVSADPVLALPGVETGVFGWPGAAEQWLPADVRLTENGKTAAQEAVNDFLDKCAETTELDDPDCPFGYDDAGIARENYSAVADVAWEITDYPDLELEMVESSDGIAAFAAYSRTQAIAKLTATGEPASGTEREDITGHRDIAIDSLRLTITSSRKFEVSYDDLRSSSYAAILPAEHPST